MPKIAVLSSELYCGMAIVWDREYTVTPRPTEQQNVGTLKLKVLWDYITIVVSPASSILVRLKVVVVTSPWVIPQYFVPLSKT